MVSSRLSPLCPGHGGGDGGVVDDGYGDIHGDNSLHLCYCHNRDDCDDFAYWHICGYCNDCVY